MELKKSRLLKIVILCVYLEISLFVGQAGGETFTSSANLIQLLQDEEKVLWNIEQYVEDERRRLAELTTLIETRREVRKKDEAKIEDAAKYVGHPLNAYRLIEQLHSISSKITDRRNEDDLRRRLSLYASPFPEETDFKGALGALLRLQRVYNITTEEMRTGSMWGQQAAGPLQPQDAFRLGMTARASGDYALSAKWLDVAMETREDEEALWKNAAMESAETHSLIGDYERALEIIEEVREKDPANDTIYYRYKNYKKQNETNYRSFRITADTWHRVLPDWKTNYEALCRGDKLRDDPKFESQLYCQYRPSFIRYGPSKEELLSVDPRVSLIYDVISDSEAEQLKNLATPMLYRSMVGDPSQAYESDERVSKVGWLWDNHENPLIQKLSKRVSFVTGMETAYRPSLSSAEPFQVVNYGMGGQYEPHVDFYDDLAMLQRVPHFLLNTGDRIITFMYYLSQPEAGGATVFPKLKIRVPPVKNAAAFWYNIRKSGEKDQRTQHAGCPVLLGEKWVANKWIRELGQEFRRPCGLTYDTPDDMSS